MFFYRSLEHFNLKWETYLYWILGKYLTLRRKLLVDSDSLLTDIAKYFQSKDSLSQVQGSSPRVSHDWHFSQRCLLQKTVDQFLLKHPPSLVRNDSQLNGWIMWATLDKLTVIWIVEIIRETVTLSKQPLWNPLNEGQSVPQQQQILLAVLCFGAREIVLISSSSPFCRLSWTWVGPSTSRWSFGSSRITFTLILGKLTGKLSKPLA